MKQVASFSKINSNGNLISSFEFMDSFFLISHAFIYYLFPGGNTRTVDTK